MKVAIYARVSTKKQDTANQLPVLWEFASKQGWDVIREFVDAVSGSGRKERPQFQAMLDAASKREFDLVLFWALDRLSREGIVKTLGYLQQFKSWGVGWRSYTQPFLDTGNQMVTDIVLSVLAAVAQQERVTISERTLAGLKRARREGKKLGRPVADLDLSKVRKMRNEGMSLRKIADKVGWSPALICKRLAN